MGFPGSLRVFVALEPCDMRAGINTLHPLVAGWFQRVRSCGVTESRTVLCGGGRRGRSLSVVGKARSRELCEALELARCTLQAASLAVLEQQPQQASCRHDQHDDDAQRY